MIKFDNNYEDEAERSKFQCQLMTKKFVTEDTYQSWNSPSLIFAFQSYFTTITKCRFQYPIYINYLELQDFSTGKKSLKITIQCHLGKISTEVPFEFIMDKVSNKFLPEKILDGFENFFKMKAKRTCRKTKSSTNTNVPNVEKKDGSVENMEKTKEIFQS